jgi:hypothetical protein
MVDIDGIAALKIFTRRTEKRGFKHHDRDDRKDDKYRR